MAQDKTERLFSALIIEYNPMSMLREEIIKRDYLLSISEIDTEFDGGVLNIPFKGAQASSVQYGKYPATAKIKSSSYVKGSLTGYKELWGSLKFNYADLTEHGDLEKSFLKLLPDEIEYFIQHMKERASQAFLNGPWMCNITAASNSAAGVVYVDRPELLELDQQVVIEEYSGGFPTVTHSIGNSNASVGYTEAYIKSIDMNTNEVVLVDASNVVLDLSAAGEDLAIGADPIMDRPKIYLVNAENVDNQFSSLRNSLLSAANGGTATLYGKTKTAYPALQALNHDGSTITSANILDKVFDFQSKTQRIGKGMPKTILLSIENMKYISKALEVSRTYKMEDRKSSVYGWDEVTIGGSKGMLTFASVNEIDNDVLMILDPRSWKIFSNGMFERIADPDGKQFYAVRGDDGFFYIVDLRFFAQFVVYRPSYNGIVYGVNL